MNLKNIEWNRVTKLSQLVAIVLFVAVFALGFLLGKTYEFHAFQNAFMGKGGGTGSTVQLGSPTIADVTFSCDSGKTARAIFRANEVQLLLSDGRNLTVPQAVSGSGARYASADESFVFWNKGNTAFITEGTGTAQKTTFANCAAKPIPQ